jgi:lysophospholipase L1-like esterase
MTSPATSATWSWSRRLAIALAALLLLALGGEILLRISPGAAEAALGIGHAETARQIRAQWELAATTYAPDTELGALLAPLRRDAFDTPDFHYTLQTDHAGFTNREPWPSRADVAVLGDSLLTGTGVGIDGQFTSLLERRLDGRTVLNLGLPGGGTEHQYRTYRRYAAALEPDLVIAVLWLMWDIDNSVHFAHWLSEADGEDFTQYRFSYERTHRREATGPARIWQSAKELLGNSLLVRAAYRRVNSLLGTDPTIDAVTLPNGDTIVLSARGQKRLAAGADRPDTPDLREVFFGPLQRLQSDVEAHGGRFLVVLVPSKEELYAADAFPEVLRTVDEVKAELEARQLPVLDLYPAFRERAQNTPPFYRIDAHLNALGNQIVADELESWIVEQAILPRPSAAAPDVAGSNSD